MQQMRQKQKRKTQNKQKILIDWQMRGILKVEHMQWEIAHVAHRPT